MPKLLIRVATFLLIPCLLADPILASVNAGAPAAASIYGGSFDSRSAGPNKGTTFTVTSPLAPAPGKSILSGALITVLNLLLKEKEGQAVALSTVDYWKTKVERGLAAFQAIYGHGHWWTTNVGYPGTEDSELLKRHLAAMADSRSGSKVTLPRFEFSAERYGSQGNGRSGGLWRLSLASGALGILSSLIGLVTQLPSDFRRQVRARRALGVAA
jgi:hypothetical protein